MGLIRWHQVMVDHSSYVDQFFQMVKVVQDSGVTPVLVFDGCAVPIKKRTDEKRRKYPCVRRVSE